MGLSTCVLVADDEPLLRKVTERVLSRAGLTVHTAPDAEAALRALEGDPTIEVLVVDVGLLVQGGPSDLTRLRAARARLGVVLISGDLLPEALEADLEAHGGVFLRKPFDPAALQRAIASVRP